MTVLFFFLFLLFSCLYASTSEAQMVPAIYVLGDSLVDAGNNNYIPDSPRANFLPNGLDFPNKKPTGRFCNGKNAADFLAEKVGLPLVPPYLWLVRNKKHASFIKGVNFASAGSGILNTSSEGVGRSIALAEQVDNYVKVYRILKRHMGGTEVKKHLSKSLFYIVIGNNDLFAYIRSPKLQKKYTEQEYIDLMVSSLKEQLKKLYMHGSRKWLVPDIGMIGCPPAIRLSNQTHCLEQANVYASKHNARVKKMLQELKRDLKDINYSHFSSYSIMEDILRKPSKYGFKEVKAACCGAGKLRAEAACLRNSTFCSNRKDHVYWDQFHPTEATDKIMMDCSFNSSSKYTQPMNVKQLIAI